jgi:uncharacterized membrane protein
MTRTALLALLLVLTFLGLADAWYLADAALTGTALSCSFTGSLAALSGCNQVAQSAYSHFLGLPLALYGFGFYAILFVIAAVLLTTPLRSLYRAAIILSLIAIVLSLYFVFLQFFVIKALCIYCLASMVIALLIFLVTWRLWKRFAPVKVAEPVVPTITQAS